MSFFYEEVNPDWRCKSCGAPITLDQYQRLEYCDDCQDTYDLAVFGHLRGRRTDEQIAQEVERACYPDWDKDFLLRLNEWQDKRDRLR